MLFMEPLPHAVSRAATGRGTGLALQRLERRHFVIALLLQGAARTSRCCVSQSLSVSLSVCVCVCTRACTVCAGVHVVSCSWLWASAGTNDAASCCLARLSPGRVARRSVTVCFRGRQLSCLPFLSIRAGVVFFPKAPDQGRGCIFDFLKIEKVELTVSEKGENHQESTHLLRVYCPERRCFYPVPPAAPVGRFFARRQFWGAFSLALLAFSLRPSRSLSPSDPRMIRSSHSFPLRFRSNNNMFNTY